MERLRFANGSCAAAIVRSDVPRLFLIVIEFDGAPVGRCCIRNGEACDVVCLDDDRRKTVGAAIMAALEFFKPFYGDYHIRSEARWELLRYIYQ
jgi:hypothetical protein